MHNNLLLSVQDLKVYFRGDETVARALEGVSYEVRRGETVCLVGESGCGKTVSALAVLGLIPRPPGEIPAGRILFNGRNLLDLDEEALQTIRGNHIAMVFQEPMTSLNPVFTVGDQISEAIRVHEKIGEETLEERCIDLLRDVGIADEPTTALDVTIQRQILGLFRELQRKRDMSLLYITHDLNVVATIADRIYVMYAGIIAEQGNRGDIFSDPRHPYTQGLLASLPHRSKKGRTLHSIPGTVPDPAFKPAGCPFHPRCGHAVAACRNEFPGMCDYGQGHLSRCPVLYEKKISGSRS
jgi:oligopeptide/dipeptide ABC transporter ATP-binding protein